MNWIRRRGRSATGWTAATGVRRRGTFGLALAMALVASLGLAISAFAAGPGVNGTGLTTTPDTSPPSYTQPAGYSAPANDGLGVTPGQIKHVWLITLENHAYNSNFTGSNANSYLWQTLPQDGALLTNYYGTGHSSLDNYLTEVSGQAPLTDDQGDCPAYTNITGASGSGLTNGVDTNGSLSTDGNYGQLVSAAGAEAPAGDNGCVYPSSVPTIFNQLDAAGKSWKVYAQDVAYPGVTGQNAGAQYCGGPDSSIGATPSAGQTVNPGASGQPDYVYGSASATSGYVAKHDPLPWFQSVIGSGDCTAGLTGGQYGNSSHLGELFGPNDALYNDLQSESTTPALSIIAPNNCSDGHDAICVNDTSGVDATNNLSGGFTGQTPNAPLNQVGGLYASDLFLEHVIPEIQQSPAYADGGLIIVNWDEAYPPFTYSSDSLTDSTTQSPTAAGTVANIDSAGETLYGRSLSWEPTGPNTPNIKSESGQALSAGPGYNEYLDRPAAADVAGTPQLDACTKGAASNGYYTLPADGCYIGGGTSGGGTEESLSPTISVSTSGLATQSIAALTTSAPSSLVSPLDEGETVTGLPVGDTITDNGSPYVGSVYVGQVSAALPAADGDTSADGTVADQGSTSQFQLVDANGNPLTFASAITSQPVTVSGDTAATDPLYDAFDPTQGGGDTGAILLSPYIKGGTVSNNYYNHYSLLRTLEDIFQVSQGSGSAPGYTGTINVSTGVDGLGHIGYAAQPGLAPFGTDVFTGVNNTVTDTVTDTVTNTVTNIVNHTYTAAGSPITVPGSAYPVTVRDNYGLVPNLIGDSDATARDLIGREGDHVGRVVGPKAKRGYTLVVASQSPDPETFEALGADISFTLKLEKNKK